MDRQPRGRAEGTACGSQSGLSHPPVMNLPVAPHELVEHVLPQDVLLGKGTPISEHEGNIRLREIVAERHPDYAKSRTYMGKHLVAWDVLRVIQAEGGRFLRKAKNGDSERTPAVWEVIQDEMKCVSKVKQLFRDLKPDSMKNREQRRRETRGFQRRRKKPPASQKTTGTKGRAKTVAQKPNAHRDAAHQIDSKAKPPANAASAHRDRNFLENAPHSPPVLNAATRSLQSGVDPIRLSAAQSLHPTHTNLDGGRPLGTALYASYPSESLASASLSACAFLPNEVVLASQRVSSGVDAGLLRLPGYMPSSSMESLQRRLGNVQQSSFDNMSAFRGIWPQPSLSPVGHLPPDSPLQSRMHLPYQGYPAAQQRQAITQSVALDLLAESRLANERRFLLSLLRTSSGNPSATTGNVRDEIDSAEL